MAVFDVVDVVVQLVRHQCHHCFCCVIYYSWRCFHLLLLAMLSSWWFEKVFRLLYSFSTSTSSTISIPSSSFSSSFSFACCSPHPFPFHFQLFFIHFLLSTYSFSSLSSTSFSSSFFPLSLPHLPVFTPHFIYLHAYTSFFYFFLLFRFFSFPPDSPLLFSSLSSYPLIPLHFAILLLPSTSITSYQPPPPPSLPLALDQPTSFEKP